MLSSRHKRRRKQRKDWSKMPSGHGISSGDRAPAARVSMLRPCSTIVYDTRRVIWIHRTSPLSGGPISGFAMTMCPVFGVEEM